jgi:hypothetical protein
MLVPTPVDKRMCFDTLHDEFPFYAQGEMQPTEYFSWALVNMCQQIDASSRDGDVLFYCKAGKHRSLAAAMAYIMWSSRPASFQGVLARMLGLHPRLCVSEYTQKIHGRTRRALAADLRKWEDYLARCKPPSFMLPTPVLLTTASGM